MLIHVSKFQKVQQKVQDQVINYLDNLRKFFLNKNTEVYNANLNFFKDIWEKNFLAYKEKFKDKTYPTWQQLIDNEKSINFVISELVKNIKLLNGESNDELNYEDHINKWNFGLHTIVIGGDKLSRGLTLEGLSMSYFLRSAKMPMYDTLMQMGRWFGYREGYDDLCRLFTNRDIAEFSGSVFIPETTRAPFCLFQIKNAADQGSRSTTAMLHHYDGAIKWYAGDTFARNVKGRWVSFKVVHDGPKGDIHMTVDGQYKKYAAEKTVRNFGFKFGVYGINKQNKVHEKFQANFKDI
jgi:hypothetical protein